MRDTNRVLGHLRIFQSVVNDTSLKHELVKFADGTERWVYTYEGTDPYELEDAAFEGTVAAIEEYAESKQTELSEEE